ncbi:MAG: hypothetical protein AB8B88_05270 [Devosiaceae bacterium]
MFLGYVGALAGGIGVAATLLTLSKIFRFNLPRWMYPAAAGIGMLLLTIHIEYSWLGQVEQGLPPEIEIVETFNETIFYQPWTYIIPRVHRFIAVDHGTARLNPDVENMVLIDTLLMERITPALIASQFIDCATGARMLTGDTIELDDSGMPVDGDWINVGLDDPLINVVCTRHATLGGAEG